MIRVEFTIPPSGVPYQLYQQLHGETSLRVDDVLNAGGDRYYEFLTLSTTVGEDHLKRVLSGLTAVREYRIRSVAGDGRTHRLRLFVDESGPCVVRQMLRAEALPHRIHMTEPGYSIAASVRSWEHMKTLAETMETTYGTFELDGVTQDPAPQFDCLQPADVLDGLTERRRHLLETAYRMGYFDVPREVTAAAVADRLDISSAAFSERLRETLSALLEDVFGPEVATEECDQHRSERSDEHDTPETTPDSANPDYRQLRGGDG